MEKEYNPKEFEEKWYKYWEESKLFKAEDFSEKPKFYILVMFPYPSGSGLHVGHCRNYIPADTYARYKRMQGFNVLHPIGYDAFGLPAENYAIEHGIHPRESTYRNIENFRRQLKMLGLSYDWDREFATSDPEYYKWTEWFFELLFKRGLAYQDRSFQWWCPHCKTVLANEQIIDGKCWRCGTPVVKKELKEWFFRITHYADKLLEGLDRIDWPERIKSMQRNWIGRSEGAEITFKGVGPDGTEYDLPVFTTRIDTIFGVTFLAIAPEHPLVMKLTREDKVEEVKKYIEEALRKFETERLSTEKEKTGVFTGCFARNPFTDELVPIYVGDYVVYSYGTGAVMGVPAHDERDFQFAKKHNLPIKIVISKDGSLVETLEEAFTEDGILINSNGFSGLRSDEARKKLTKYAEEHGFGRGVVRYKIRDWLISRQRYWGAPIPIIHCPEHGAVPVPEEDLPVLLPDEVDFSPRDTGESPLANDPDFVNTSCPICGKPSRRETDTQDGFACSSWYFLRYADPHNDKAPFDKEKVKYWLPVDLYIGGAEHAVMHLLYARFYTMVMYDAGLIDFDEPFKKLLNQGMILGADHQKMSKSRGNVVNPDDVIKEYGADTLRAYILFIGPLDTDAPWSTEGINGVNRFIKRMWNLFIQLEDKSTTKEKPIEKEIELITDKMIVKVTEQIERFKFNTMISSFMEWLNFLSKITQEDAEVMETKAYREAVQTFLTMIAPATPFVAEELYHRLGGTGSIHKKEWPKPKGIYKEEYVTIIVQVNGKLRDKIEVEAGSELEDVLDLVKKSDKITRLGIDFNKAKYIFVKDKLINIVA
ncbi:leucine--tRNA ligase [Caldisericum exile]|uniref:Leucine--tRNA ligase n=1 Tax=Caldisericum exile (strain DSM 21853 / NBRC 104410 / AZM16c01) TaxID=511051 RepID=A0A7U6GE40_CALEA|nr:leucine--tRNA ligase [Caldisericum exile]BAL80702.1 leucyl-tRNA synthetase [Caldisericum exile AZM16c01]